ncbi:MAG TPA: rhomboid family intramembrane serine protease [Vicinamibacteria bacterium]|nr:rhomboid family intramembrane serine protease [Vicinamibacteria bacterium]
MILLIPLGPDVELPRLPRATLALIALSVLAFFWTSRFDAVRSAAEEARLERIAAWTIGLLERDLPELGEARRHHASALDYLASDGGWREAVPEGELRDRLERCVEERGALRDGHPFYRWGFVPAEITLPRLLAHQFLHADLVHLLFNMIFLWAVGGLIESVWGALLVAGLYVVSGIVAALVHAAFAPGGTEPAIGASGAVAGLMGFFAVAHAREPMRLALVAGVSLAPRVRLFTLPAAVFLGLWVVEQVFWTLMTTRIDVGVAFRAQLGGFAFGAVAALGLRAAGFPRERDDGSEQPRGG